MTRHGCAPTERQPQAQRPRLRHSDAPASQQQLKEWLQGPCSEAQCGGIEHPLLQAAERGQQGRTGIGARTPAQRMEHRLGLDRSAARPPQLPLFVSKQSANESHADCVRVLRGSTG